MNPNTPSVLLVTPGLTPSFGGSAVSEASLAQYLQSRTALTVWCRRGKLDRQFVAGYGLEGSVREYRPREIFWAWLNPGHLLNHTFAKIDLVHLNGHWKWENYFLARLAVRHRKPYVLHPRGMLVPGYRKSGLKKIFNRLIGNFIMRQAARIVALSQFEVRQFAAHPIRRGQTVVIPNGITPPQGEPRATTVTRESYFLYLGRIERRKNLTFLVRAFAAYRNRGGKSRLFLIGPVERDYDREISKTASSLSVAEYVRVLPPTYGSEKWNWMCGARAVIYPTWEEPFGRVPFEALAVGAPVIVPAQSGAAEYLRDVYPDCAYDERDQNSLTRQLTFVETEPDTALRAQVTAARTWVRERLNWDVVGQEVLQMYSTILERPIAPAVDGDLRPRSFTKPAADQGERRPRDIPG